MDKRVDNRFDYRQGFIADPAAKDAATGAKAPYVDHGAGLIPPEIYYSRERADLEWKKMWTKVWCWAGVTHDLKKVGDYFRIEVGRESFIVVRSAPDKIQAFYNVCPHRGNWLVYDEYGSIAKGDSFYCNFHGWRFNIDGSLKLIKDEELFRRETIADLKELKEVRCEVWNSLVFINMDPRAQPLEEYLGVIPDHLKYAAFDRMRVYSEIMGDVDANWKVGIEAFIEFYHSDDTHPQVLPISATLKTQYDLYANGMSRMIIPQGRNGDRSDDPDEVSDGLKGFVAFFGGNPDDYKNLKGQDYQKAYADTLRKWAARNGHSDLFDKMTESQLTDDWNYHLFPTITLNVFAWGVLIQSWTPHISGDPEKHVYRAMTLHLPLKDQNQHVMDPMSYAVSAAKGWDGTGPRPQRLIPQKLEDWGTVLSQDMYRVPKVHRGVRSQSYDGHRLCESESRLRHYLAEIDRYINRA
jgi:phenylpropionate dioxygenase-like ring-hydroxylating dioxygenase large terminal subunit